MSADERPHAVRELAAGDIEWARQFLERVAGAARVVSRGRLHHCHLLAGFYVEAVERRLGLLTYRVVGSEMEVVSLHVEEDARRRRVGAALLDAARDRARDAGCRRLWLVTTNDNEPAQRFYRARGMRVAAVHQGAVDDARRELKPEIPLLGVGGVPIHDEVELEVDLMAGEACAV